MLCILTGIINKIFFKGIINKISFKAFSFNYWNIINHIFFKGILNKISFTAFSFNSWNNPYIKDKRWLLASWHISKSRGGSQPAGTFQRVEVAPNLLAHFKD